MKTFKDQWNELDATITRATEGQRSTLRETFYAGGLAYMSLIRLINKQDVSVAEKVEMIEKVNDELNAFVRGKLIDTFLDDPEKTIEAILDSIRGNRKDEPQH